MAETPPAGQNRVTMQERMILAGSLAFGALIVCVLAVMLVAALDMLAR